jgi:hypothetical protein
MLELVARQHNNSNRRGVFYVIRVMPSARQRSCKHASLIGVFYVVRAAAI